MRFVNRTARTVFLSMFNAGDTAFQFNLPLPVAAQSILFSPGQDVSGIFHPHSDPYFRLGIAEQGTFIPTVPGELLLWAPPALYKANDELQLVERGGRFEILPITPPNPDQEPRRTTPEQLNDIPPRNKGYTGLHFGIGKASITDPAGYHPMSALNMQGWSVPSQKSTSIETDNNLYARAFVVDNPGQSPGQPPHQERLVMVVCDMWTCSIAVKAEVARRLRMGAENPSFTLGNLWIAGTHTHSAPGGYLHHTLYNAMNGGFDAHVFECIVEGIFAAIEDAVLNIGEGQLSVIKRDLPGIGRNRSYNSYARNPPGWRQRPDGFYGTDPEFLQLMFERTEKGAVPVGALNWFALHTTSRGQNNLAINGDHKGWAARLLEETMSKDTGHAFVAAFANSNCGDVSGNFNPGSKMGEFSPASVADPATQIQRMMDTGQAQFDMAHSLIKEKNRAVLHGPLDWNHRFVDMTALTGTVAALGLSFTAGSTEDGDSGNSIDWSVFNDLNINGQVSEGIFLVKPATTSPRTTLASGRF